MVRAASCRSEYRYLYGPWIQRFQTTPSNMAFDADLKRAEPPGLKIVEEFAAEAGEMRPILRRTASNAGE